MKNSVSLTIISLIQLVCLITFLPLSRCRPVLVPNDANLIDQTCQKTPDHDLCVSSLQSDPRSASADVAGLGVIMVDVVKAKASGSLDKIDGLLGQKPGDQTLTSCKDKYNAVVQADVPQAREAFTKGDPKFAEQGMNDAANEADSCESGFSGGSPITDLNKAAHDVAAVAAAIARTLL